MAILPDLSRSLARLSFATTGTITQCEGPLRSLSNPLGSSTSFALGFLAALRGALGRDPIPSLGVR